WVGTSRRKSCPKRFSTFLNKGNRTHEEIGFLGRHAGGPDGAIGYACALTPFFRDVRPEQDSDTDGSGEAVRCAGESRRTSFRVDRSGSQGAGEDSGREVCRVGCRDGGRGGGGSTGDYCYGVPGGNRVQREDESFTRRKQFWVADRRDCPVPDGSGDEQA